VWGAMVVVSIMSPRFFLRGSRTTIASLNTSAPYPLNIKTLLPCLFHPIPPSSPSLSSYHLPSHSSPAASAPVTISHGPALLPSAIRPMRSGLKHRTIMPGQLPINFRLPPPSSYAHQGISAQPSTRDPPAKRQAQPTTINISLSLSTPTPPPPMPHDTTTFLFRISSMIGRPIHCDPNALPNPCTRIPRKEWSQHSNPIYPQPPTSAEAFITDLMTQYPTLALDTHDEYQSQPAEYITPRGVPHRHTFWLRAGR